MSGIRCGLSLTARHAAFVRVTPVARGWPGRRGRRLTVCDHRVVDLPPGLLRPSPIGPNIADPEALAETIRPLMAGRPPGRLALSLPDLAATVLLLPAGDVAEAGSRTEQDAFIRWRAERLLPYPPAEARLAIQRLEGRGGDGRGGDGPCPQFLVVAIRESVLARYQAVMGRLGLKPAVVDLASFHLFNLYAESVGTRVPPDAGWVFLHHGDTSLTLMLFLSGSLRAIRLKRLASERSEGAAATDRVFRELMATLAAYGEAHDLCPVTHLFLSGYPPGAAADRLEQQVRADLRLEVERLEPRRLDGPHKIDGIVTVADAEMAPLIPALAAAVAR